MHASAFALCGFSSSMSYQIRACFVNASLVMMTQDRKINHSSMMMTLGDNDKQRPDGSA